MEPFLEKLASHLLKSHADNFSRLCLVFPGRRAGLFFRKYMSRMIEKPVWLPEIYALEDFVIHNSGLKLSDPLDLISYLYKVYKSIEREKAQPFSDFISWGNMLLTDFDEIDQYLADGQKVFQYLDEIKALKHWNPNGEPLTAFELSYLQFYNSLAPTYTQFREKLLNNNEAYFGLAFERLLSDLKNKSFGEWDKIIFAGFNALTRAEENLIKYLIEIGKAEIYWDADEYYLLNPQQEAGHFLREYLKNNTFGPLNWIGNSLKEEKKSIHILGVSGNVGQAKIAGGLLTEIMQKKTTPDGVALVLVDENLLLPVLNSIPSELGNFNVTMGFPLKQTPVFSLLNTVISLFANATRFAQNSDGTNQHDFLKLRFYHKDVQRFISHPFIISAKNKEDSSKKLPENELISRSFYSPEELLILLQNNNLSLAGVFEPYLVKSQIQPGDIIKFLSEIISFLRNTLSPVKNDENDEQSSENWLVDEYLYHASQLCSKLKTIANDPELNPNLQTLQSMVNTLIGSMRLPFYGEPLNGLQVMGMLETRLLDFTDIIMVSVNEGMLPKGKHQATFIPDEVRTHFGMHRYTERTAVFAYHFYRLMQKTENAWLIYNTEGDELGGGEKSRFISQMIYELPQLNKKMNLFEQNISIAPGDKIPDPVIVDKTPETVARLLQMAERGLSPTALAIYLRCELQFYFSQVLRISEPDTVSETIDAAVLGEIIHEALQNTYESRKTKLVTPETIESMLPEAILQVKAAFASKYKNEEISTGKNLLIVKVAENMVKRFLMAEKSFLEQTKSKIEIIYLEENLESNIRITEPRNGDLINVKIHGKADRIDRVGGITRIIDYKTGNVEMKDMKTDQISSLRDMKNPSKLLQVLTYALMYKDMHEELHMELNSGIISLRKTSAYFIKSEINKSNSINQELLNGFRKELEGIITNIYNVSEPFRQTENLETCNHCAFKIICNRTVN